MTFGGVQRSEAEDTSITAATPLYYTKSIGHINLLEKVKAEE